MDTNLDASEVALVLRLIQAGTPALTAELLSTGGMPRLQALYDKLMQQQQAHQQALVAEIEALRQTREAKDDG